MSNRIINSETTLKEAWDRVLTELSKAAGDSAHAFRNMVLTTIDQSGSPQSRTVVMREYNDTGHIHIYTDIRSAKADHIKNDSRVSLLFYDDIQKLQLRITGHAEVHHNDRMAMDHRKGISHRSSFSYTSVQSPGAEVSGPGKGWDWNEGDLNNFCVIEIQLSEMEFLQLNKKKHLRARRLLKEGMYDDSWLVP